MVTQIARAAPLTAFLIRQWKVRIPAEYAGQKNAPTAFVLWARTAYGLRWSERRGSNSLPPPWQGGALPDELHSRLVPNAKLLYYRPGRLSRRTRSFFRFTISGSYGIIASTSFAAAMRLQNLLSAHRTSRRCRGTPKPRTGCADRSKPPEFCERMILNT